MHLPWFSYYVTTVTTPHHLCAVLMLNFPRPQPILITFTSEVVS